MLRKLVDFIKTLLERRVIKIADVIADKVIAAQVSEAETVKKLGRPKGSKNKAKEAAPEVAE